MAHGFGEWLMRERRKRGMNQKEIAEKSDLSRATVSRLEKGDIGYTRETIRALAAALEANEAEALAAAGLLPDAAPDEQTVRLVTLWGQMPQRLRQAVLEIMESLLRHTR